MKPAKARKAKGSDPRRKKLTDEAWRNVFRLRCLSKRGQELSTEERALVNAAFDEDPERYDAMEADVFNATVPFGSKARRHT